VLEVHAALNVGGASYGYRTSPTIPEQPVFDDDPRLANVDLPPEVDIVGARLDRCTHLFESFRVVWEDHLASGPHQLGVEVDDVGNGRIVFTRLSEPPVELSLILGEFLYELRAALDNALFAVAIIDSGQNPPPRAATLEWPICIDEAAWESQRRRRLDALSAELQDALHTIQPFQAEFPTWNCLKILNDMARVDRHRAVHFVTSFASNGWMKHNLDLVLNLEVFPGPVPPDGTLARFRWLGDFEITPDYLDGRTKFDVEVAGVQLGPGPNTSEPVRPWGTLEGRLRALHRAVTEYAFGLIDLAVDLATAVHADSPGPTDGNG